MGGGGERRHLCDFVLRSWRNRVSFRRRVFKEGTREHESKDPDKTESFSPPSAHTFPYIALDFLPCTPE